MNKWKTTKTLKAEKKQLKAENEYLVRKWGTEVLKNHHNKLKNRIMQGIYLMALTAIALISSPKIPITSFCSTTGLCPFYKIWEPIFIKINNILSERTKWNQTIEIDNVWLVIIGIWIAGITLIILIEVHKKDKEVKEQQ